MAAASPLGDRVGPRPIEGPVLPVDGDRDVALAGAGERVSHGDHLLARVAFLQVREPEEPESPPARRQPGRERLPRRREIGEVGIGGQRRVARMGVRVAADLMPLVEPALEERLVVGCLHVAGDDEGDRRDAVLLQHREQRLGRGPAGGGVAARRGADDRQIVHGDEQRPAGRRRACRRLCGGPCRHQRDGRQQRDPRERGAPRAHAPWSPTIASASISTSMSGSMSPLTSTIAVAGRMAPKTSPCARPTASQSRSMLIT